MGHMNQLEGIFSELGITQYLGAFVDQGFDSWDTILDITESDLDALGVKLGHRRKLQRRIANHRGLLVPATNSLLSPTRTSIEDSPVTSSRVQHPEVKEGPVPTKRKYRRHPKPDENAPERPPSAYVLFSNKMREDLKGQNLSFTEIAKLVGENWQSLDRPEKEPFETQAQVLKEKYNRDMAEYKKSSDFKRYAEYLQDFRKRQAHHDAHKRARVDADGSNRKSLGGSLSLAASVTTSNTGSGSEGHPGSEPPPTRQQRLSSIASHQSDPHVSPVISSHTFPRLVDDGFAAQLPLVQNDHVSTRPRGFSSPSSKGVPDQQNPRRPHENPMGLGFPPMSQLDGSRITMAPVSHSPDAGIQSIVPARTEDGRSSGRNSGSSSYWTRPPSLRTEQSSTNSVSTLSSFNQPRTPSESSLPIHALLSSSADGPTFDIGATLPKVPALPNTLPLSQQYTGRLPGDQFAPYMNGPHRPSLSSQYPPVAPLVSSFAQAPPSLPRINSNNSNSTDSGLDGMSALLRASDIVGRPEQ